MTDMDVLRRLAKISALLAVVVGIVSTLAAFAAFGWDAEATVFGHPQAILGRGPEAALLFRWAFLGDMFYSYLLLVPLALFLHRRLRDRRPWLADLGLAGGLAYIFLGGAGAAILATAGSTLIEAYATAAPAERPAIATSYGLVRDIVYYALWQTLDAITLGTWVATTGWLLLTDRPLLGRLLVVLGLGGWAAALMTMLDVHSIGVIAGGFLVALAVWLGWVSLQRARRRAGPQAT
ncbi:MAG TPA: hypothetical protein VFK38_01260 [Candidatus Limnocylindrales bacterium]|nr:hypothetical protein [Candidatus Limnocylindrales bacterium]